jgi:succinate dehydrogenase/fumarate reductase flavoprotein subunit
MEFNFDFLRKEGNALKNFDNSNIEDEEERSTAESIKAAIEKEQEKIKSIEQKDSDEESSDIEQILKEAEDKKDQEKKEKGLDEKLADIEKVISTFGDKTNLSSKTADPFKGTKFSLNKPLDFSTAVAKNYVTPYLAQPTSQDDRIKLLFESLKKQNLI